METELRENIVIAGADAAAAKIGQVASAAGRAAISLRSIGAAAAGAATRVAHAFHGITEVAAAAGGIAGIWQIAEAVRDVDHLYQAVMRVKDMTGIAAEHAHAMFDMFELSGVQMESAERIITSMTRQGEKLEDGMAGVGGQAQRMHQMMARLGISIKAGPEDRLFAMAKAAKAGKLDIAQLISTFAIPRSQASAMMSMLKQGPDKLRAIQQDTMKGADAIDDRTLESYRSMLQIRRELKDAWGDLIGTFYKHLIPVITEALKSIKHGFEEIQPIATQIGTFLSTHMQMVVSLAKTWLALSIANRAVNMFSENKLGLFGRGQQLFGAAKGAITGRAAKVGAMDYFEARALNPGAGMFSKAGGGMLSSISAGLGRTFSSLGSSAASLIPRLGQMAVSMGPVGLVIVAIVVAIIGAYYVLKNNILGLGDKLKSAFGGVLKELSESFSRIKGALKELWDALKPIVQVLLTVVGTVVVSSLYQFAIALQVLLKVINFVIDVMMQSPAMKMIRWIGDKWKEMAGTDGIDEIKDAVSAGGVGTGDAPKVNMDFRGSKFEITNNFPPGIDGGRVAVAFGDELAKLGERRLDSGVRPLYSYR